MGLYDTLNSGLTDLHIHLGGAVPPHVLWAIAHQHGYKLPVRKYHDFVNLITYKQHRDSNLEDYISIMHQWTERIQSSPAAIETCVYETISHEFRESGVSKIELRFNPMKRNEDGGRDLDHIIRSALSGMKRAHLEYGVEAGLIFCMAREYDTERNDIIINKAVAYSDDGVCGVDIAGTEKITLGNLDIYAKMVGKAKRAGLGVTIHLGETPEMEDEELASIMQAIGPDRVGHGIRAAWCPKFLEELVKSDAVVELCPSSNFATNAIDVEGMKLVVNTFKKNKILFTINTDGPQLLSTNLKTEFEIMIDYDILSLADVITCTRVARSSSFIER
mgnify:CR=1 FL=1